MAGKKKFGAFAGVFTPSILTILGVIMYMRMGWVVGNAGLIGTIIIIVIAHVISISTGLSISSIATDKKVGAGGIYYILSRSMGIPIGGAIGLTLYVGTAFSIALYLIGFAESFNGYFGFDTGINGLRISGAIALLVLTAIALISTSFALKTQFFILAAILISLASIAFGTHEFAPESVALFAKEGSVPLEIIFAIFFPAVTGFTAGIAMSGDLKDPKKDIPFGTIASIAVGFVVYIGLAFFLANYINSDVLKSDYNILMKIALYAPAVVAGIWGATLSSALGGILGGPRILQAMSLDKVTPKVFGRGKGKNNEPVNALILVFIIALAGILIGQLDVIARVVSMFYLAAYGVINLSFFLESWANPDFQPTFKVKRWVGLIGFIASFAVMFKLDMLAMFGSIVIIFGIYFWLQRKQLALETGDVWQSVWENIVSKGLKKLDAKVADTSNNWNPNIILFSGESKHRQYLLDLSKTISGQTGIVTNFKLIIDKENSKPLTRSKQIVKEANFENLGIFARQVKVDNIYRGIENIASTFGFSGVEPNSIMMGWPKQLNDSSDYSVMTQKLLHLDYNLLYLDFDRKAKFGNYQTVDFWWRETDNKNAEMMLNIARFILQSPKWHNARIRVLFVNHNNIDNNIIKSKILKLVENIRVNVEIKIINNGVEQKPFYEIIAIQSVNTDLTLLGIPDIKTEKQAEFILNTNHLFESIGSTLLVKASNNFNEVDLNLTDDTFIPTTKAIKLNTLPVSENKVISDLVNTFDSHLFETANLLSKPALSSIASNYHKFFENIEMAYNSMFKNIDEQNAVNYIISKIQLFLVEINRLSDDLNRNKIPSSQELLDKGIHKLLNSRNEFISNTPRRVKYYLSNTKKSKNIHWRYILDYYNNAKILPNTKHSLYNFGVQNFMLLNNLAENIIKETQVYLESLVLNDSTNKKPFSEFKATIAALLNKLKKESLVLENDTLNNFNSFERDLCIDLIKTLESPDIINHIKKLAKKINKNHTESHKTNISSYASDWKRNQGLAHNQVTAELSLFSGGLSIFKTNEKIRYSVKTSSITPQYEKIKVLTDATNCLLDKMGDKGENDTLNKEVDILAENSIHLNFAGLLENEEENILSISHPNSSSTKLMSAKSFNVLFEHQNETVESIELLIPIIQDHLIQTAYLEPLHESTQKLEKVYNQISEEIYNTANLIKQLIHDAKKTTKTESNEETLLNIQTRIKSMLSGLDEISLSFKHDLTTNLHNTLSDLRLRNIIEKADSLGKSGHTIARKTKLRSWYETKLKTFNESYQMIVSFIIQRQQDIDNLNFDKKHNQYLSIIEQVNNFMNSLQINPSVYKLLPFYYKKLFTGSHIANSNTTNRAKQLHTAHNALKRIDSGINGAILVLGDSLSGKSFFTESLVKSLKKVEKHQINPPSKQKFDTNDLHQAFQKTFNKSGTTDTIIRQLEAKSVFIFNDLEKWWFKGETGSAVINYLAKMIEKYGSNHYFILNCNVHSYHIIRKTSQLEKQIVSSIIMAPSSKVELKEIILNRHKIAGAEIWFNEDLISDSKKTDPLFTEIHNKSKGNIGVALNRWISSIEVDTDRNLFITKIKNPIFPTIKSANWKLLLYHLLIHNRLGLGQLKKILATNESDWIIDTLQEMQKSGLVNSLQNHIYTLDVNAIPHIENWLKKSKIIS